MRSYNPTCALPEELIALDQWIVWKAVPKPGKPKPDKVPRDRANTRNVDAHGRANQMPHDDAVAAYNANPSLAGIGIAIREENGIVAVDLDHVIDLKTGEIDPAALETVRDLGTYCEVSPSGDGLHLFMLGSLPKEARRKVGDTEVYNSGRFLTVTGNVFGADLPIVRNDAALDRLLARMESESRAGKAPSTSSAAPVVIDDATKAELRSALASLRADDRDLWIGVAHDLHEVGEVGRALWLEWSQTSDKYQPGDSQQWDSIKSSRSGYRNVFARAQRAGWCNPMAGNAPATLSPVHGARTPLASAIPHGWKLDRIGNLLAQPTRTEWLIRGVLERNALACLFGQSGHGKSFVALDIAASIATGTEWHNRKTHAGAVAFLAGEGGIGLRKRSVAWQLARGISLDDAPLYISSAAIDVSASRDVIVSAVEEACAGIAPQLLIVDTLDRHIGDGRDENSTQDMRAFISACDEIKGRLSCALLVIHHTGHGNTDRTRGASNLPAALDWSWQASKGDGGPIILKCRKSKDFDLPEPMQFELRGVELPWLDDEGEHEHSAVVYPSAAAVAATGGNQLIAMEHLRKLLAELDGFVTMKAWRSATQLDRKRWPEVRDSLVSTGAVVIEGDYVRLP